MSYSESPLVLDPAKIGPLEHAFRAEIVKEGDPSQLDLGIGEPR